MVIGAIGLFILGGVLSWVMSTAHLNERNGRYYVAVAAAEAATEKVITGLESDYREGGPARVDQRLAVYRESIPTPDEHPLWANYRFSDGAGHAEATAVEPLTSWAVAPLLSQYRGLSGYAATFQITSHARDLLAHYPVAGGVQQEIQLATIPLFQFAIFYNLALEINPGPNMTVNGRVHSNGDIFAEPQAALNFLGDVTAAGAIAHHKMPDDPVVRSPGTITYSQAHDGGVNALQLPIGTDNSPTAVHQIVELPVTGESPTGPLGQQRFYNKADLILVVRDEGVDAHGGVALGLQPQLSWSTVSAFVNTNTSFFNKREGKTVKATQLDIGGLKAWNNTVNPLKTALGHDVSIVYVADLRSQTTDTQPGVRLVNGQSLPPLGLTVATPDPLYVQGHYNVVAAALGTGDTSQAKPAALVADAITVLSTAWQDSKSNQSLSQRTAQDTTVNAAFLAGIVPTTPSSYSGGVENFPRFLENWSSRVFTYNGSMIVMYPSQVATALWRGTGSTIGIYNPPTRRWNFDLNFSDPRKLPPGTPSVLTLIRGNWKTVAANDSP
jgi:hypothetical protein